jgi:hypothetical protein
MIPVTPQPEPSTFDQLVRQPGHIYLNKNKTKQINQQQWKEHNYWTRCLLDLHIAYNGICAYSGHWMPPGEGNCTVEHVIPKAIRRDLAYEWSNYMLVNGILNGRKGTKEDLINPFLLQPDWVFLDFPSLLVKPNPRLTDEEKQRVINTINVFRLNEDERIMASRTHWLKEYCTRKYGDFDFLKQYAPFTASELIRQGLVEEIKNIMKY